MKKLQPKEEFQPKGPVPPVYANEKERLIGDLHDYIGPDGYIPVTEHGNRPSLNAIAFDYDGMILAKSIGKNHRRRIEYIEMDTEMLRQAIIELFRYANYCRLYA